MKLIVDDKGDRDFTSTVQCVTDTKFEKGVAPDLGPKNFEGNIDFDIGKKSKHNFKIDKKNSLFSEDTNEDRLHAKAMDP